MISRVLRLVALCIGAQCLGGQVLAQTIEVRSGEHDGFTRLVFLMPAGTPWQLGRTGDGYGLRLETTAEVAPEGVFRRIDRSRVAALEVVPGGVDLTLGCDCRADAYLYRPDALVVDIVDGAPEPGSEFETALMPQPAAPRPAMPVRPAVLPMVLPSQMPPGAAGPLVAAAAPLIAAATSEPERPAAPAEPVGRDGLDALAETEARLFESLAEAAAAGLLVLEPGAGNTGAGPTAAAPPEPSPSQPPPSQPRGPGVAARTGLGTRTPGQAAGAAPFCPPDGTFDVATWANPDDSFETGLTRARDALIDEAGDPTAAGATALARFYIAAGLGREALVTMDLVHLPRRETETLRAMARLLDDRPDGPGFPVAMAGCGGPAQLWSILIRGTAEGVAAPDLAAAQTAFVLLPDPLIGLLGPRLTRILSESGHATAADAIFSGTRRSNSVVETEAALAEADLALSRDGPEAAVEALSQTASDPDRLSAESVIQLIDLSLRGGIPIADETLDLAATLRFEARGTPVVGALAQAEIRGRIARDEFAPALALIGETRADLNAADEGAAARLMTEALTAFAERAGDDAFLAAAYRPLPPEATPAVRDAYAGRVEELGFPDRAAEIRAGEPVLPDMPTATGAATGAAHDVTEPLAGHAAASADVAGHPPPLAAEASHDAEVAVPQPADGAPTASLEAWRGGEWTALEAGSDPLLSEAATAAMTAAISPDGPPLAAREQLLTETEQTRTMIEALLDRFPAPAEPAPE